MKVERYGCQTGQELLTKIEGFSIHPTKENYVIYQKDSNNNLRNPLGKVQSVSVLNPNAKEFIIKGLKNESPKSLSLEQEKLIDEISNFVKLSTPEESVCILKSCLDVIQKKFKLKETNQEANSNVEVYAKSALQTRQDCMKEYSCFEQLEGLAVAALESEDLEPSSKIFSSSKKNDLNLLI